MSENENQPGDENTPQEPAAPEASPAETFDARMAFEGLSQQVSQLVQALAPKAPPKPEESPEQIAELYKTNPAAAIEKVVEKSVQKHTGSIKENLTQQQQKAFYDNRAQTDFPQLTSDPAFQKLVKSQMSEMIQSGEMKPDSPTLVLRAAQIAALKYKPKAETGTKPAPAGMSAEAPRSGGTPPRQSTTDNAQYEALSKMFGVKDKEKMKARWESHQQRRQR